MSLPRTYFKRAIQKTADGTVDLIQNKIADQITRASKTSPNNKSETNEKEKLEGRYKPSE